MLSSDEDIKKGLQLGADDYIVKSQHALAEIVEKVKSFLAKGSHPAAHGVGGPRLEGQEAKQAKS